MKKHAGFSPMLVVAILAGLSFLVGLGYLFLEKQKIDAQAVELSLREAELETKFDKSATSTTDGGVKDAAVRTFTTSASQPRNFVIPPNPTPSYDAPDASTYYPPINDSQLDSSYVPLGRNKGVVVFERSGCDYFIVETSMGYSLLEWYGGFFMVEGDTIYGDLNSYGFKDMTNGSGNDVRVWIDDYMLSESNALEKYYDGCN